MKSRPRSRRIAFALSLSFVWTAAASAQGLAWQVPAYAQVPSATGFGGHALSLSGDGAAKLIIGAAWAGPANWSLDIQHPRFVAIDASSGQRLWQRDIDGPCATQRDGIELVALFANGDAAVATVASDSVNTRHFACYARLDGNDGHVVWSKTDYPELPDTQSIRVTDIVVDHDGDVVATGSHADRMRTLKLSGSDGARSWTREENTVAGQSMSGVAVTIDANNAVVAMLESRSATGQYQRQMVSLNGADGSPHWRLTTCAQNAGRSRQWSPRALADGTLVVVDSCGASLPYRVNAIRVAGDDGHVIWQRGVDATRATYEIDASGDVIVIGSFSVNGSVAGLARFAAGDGALLWSVPGAIGDSTAEDSVDLGTALGNASVYVWELIGNRYSMGVYATRLSRYDAATGQLMRRVDVSEPAKDYLSRVGHVQPLPGGDVLLGSLSLYANDARWVWLARVQPLTGTPVWVQREPVAAAQVLDLRPTIEPSGTTMVASSNGVAGIVIAGRATPVSRDRDSYPYVTKIAQRDGRLLWRWQPQPVLPNGGHIDEIAIDPAGQVIVAGYAQGPDWSAAPLLAKVDAATGQTRWLKFADDVVISGVAIRSIALDAMGNPFVLSPLRLQRRAGADGQLLWDVAMPDGDWNASAGRVAVDALGNAIAAAPYAVGTTTHGLQVAKFRSSDGVRLWLRRFSSTQSFPTITELAMLPSGDVVVAGHDDNEKHVLARLDGSSGAVVWQRQDLAAPALLIDRAGQIVIGGAASGGSSPHWLISRLNAANGGALWRNEFPGFNGASITRLALDANDGLLVAGRGSSAAHLVASVSIKTGQLRWSAANAPETYYNADNYPVGVTRGDDGSVFLAGNAEQIYPAPVTATVLKFTGPFSDDIYANGFD